MNNAFVSGENGVTATADAESDRLTVKTAGHRAVETTERE